MLNEFMLNKVMLNEVMLNEVMLNLFQHQHLPSTILSQKHSTL